MADIAFDPYAGAESEEERLTIYNNLQKQYEQEVERVKLLNQQVYEPLKRDWDHYRAVQLEQDSKFLKSVITISAGVFGVSFAFIDRLIPFQSAAEKPVLVAGWALFALALVLSVLCHILSSFIHGKYCDDILQEVEASYSGKPHKTVQRWYYGWAMSLLEWLSFTSLTGGMGCLVYFVLRNM